MEKLTQIWDLVQSVAIDPTSNLTVAVLLMAMLIIVVLMAAAIIYLLLVLRTSGTHAPDHADESDDTRPDEPGAETALGAPPDRGDANDSTRNRPAGSAPKAGDRRFLAVGLAVFAIAIAATYGLTGTRTFCADACHSGSEAVVSAGNDAHVSVSCAACHEARGVWGAPANIAWRLECVGAQLTGDGVGQRPVPARRCLACHEAILGETLENEERGLRMDHAEPIEAGMSCEDCHGHAGHGTELVAGMNPCLRCHDGERVSAECSVCHMGDPTTAAISERVFPAVRVANRDCGGCHDLAPCDACHGTRMPHSETFIAYAHAKDAAFERKESCYLCHETSDCGACHASWDLGHGATAAARLADHREKMTRSAFEGRAGCTCHSHNPYRNYCAICHEEAGSVF